MRLNRYPPCLLPDLALDYACTRFYWRLIEVKRKSTGDWIRVKPISRAFIVDLEINLTPIQSPVDIYQLDETCNIYKIITSDSLTLCSFG
jgi:hypothetical protein